MPHGRSTRCASRSPRERCRPAEPPMIEFSFDKVRNVLCLGAHSDDIEIGCGGTLLKLARDHRGLNVWWVVFSGAGSRSREARASAKAFLADAGRGHIVVKQFRDRFFPAQAER